MTLSLDRKYRPETFADVAGQDHVQTTLRNAVVSGNVAHAYLFCGPRGTGKTTTARILAKALLCTLAPTDQPCGTCPQCQEITDGIHPDVYELDAASRTGVDNVREEIISRMPYAPVRGSYKIYIIDEVHMLSTAAFNALLKTLEEPPTHVIFVLCTTDPHKVPETIQSRCQRFDFHRLRIEEIIARLGLICEREGFKAEPEALQLIAQRSQGGMRNAIKALEQIAVFGAGTISYSAAEDLLGEVSSTSLFSVAELIARRDVASCFAWVASFTQGGTDIAQLVRDLSAHVRDLYVVAAVGPGSLEGLLDGDEEQIEAYRQQAAAFGSVDRLAYILTVLGDLSTELKTAASARLALEVALTRMARPDSDLSLEALAARVAILEQGGLVSVPAAKAAGTIAEAAGAMSDAQRLWASVVKGLEQQKKRRTLDNIGGSQPHLDPATGGLLIELPTNAAFAKQSLERPEVLALLRQLLHDASGRDLSITFSLGPPLATTATSAPNTPEPEVLSENGEASIAAVAEPEAIIQDVALGSEEPATADVSLDVSPGNGDPAT
ncbi:MAG: DNA polymerase III subunit gamma/tau, partial [Coriobacteriales bacterium]|nr:DNA polymerase III subunit gamma/tau [Coriobacteriales bacterium]